MLTRPLNVYTNQWSRHTIRFPDLPIYRVDGNTAETNFPIGHTNLLKAQEIMLVNAPNTTQLTDPGSTAARIQTKFLLPAQ